MIRLTFLYLRKCTLGNSQCSSKFFLSFVPIDTPCFNQAVSFQSIHFCDFQRERNFFISFFRNSQFPLHSLKFAKRNYSKCRTIIFIDDLNIGKHFNTSYLWMTIPYFLRISPVISFFDFFNAYFVDLKGFIICGIEQNPIIPNPQPVVIFIIL